MKKLLISIILLSAFQASEAQSLDQMLFSVCGANVSYNQQINIDYSCGEVATLTLVHSDVVLTQGFKQPFSGILFTTVTEAVSAIRVSMYPNPATDHVNINIRDPLTSTANIRMLEAGGRLVREASVTASPGSEIHFRIPVYDLTPGIYFLQISTEGKKVENLKLIVRSAHNPK